MTFNDICGNEKLIARLQDVIASRNICHAYIFEAGADTDKLSFAKCFVKAIMCNSGGCDSCPTCRKIDINGHEDVKYVFADGASLKDKQIEELQLELRKKPFGDRNIAIISDADTMTPYAQNRLLKTLEEPAFGTVIVLLCDNIEGLLPTIRSRCVAYRLDDTAAIDEEAFQAASEIEEMLYDGEKFYVIKAYAEKLSKDREQTRRVLDCLEKRYAAYLLRGDVRYTDQQVYDAIDAIEDTRRRVMRNMNASYALKEMMIKIGGI